MEEGLAHKTFANSFGMKKMRGWNMILMIVMRPQDHFEIKGGNLVQGKVDDLNSNSFYMSWIKTSRKSRNCWIDFWKKGILLNKKNSKQMLHLSKLLRFLFSDILECFNWSRRLWNIFFSSFLDKRFFFPFSIQGDVFPNTLLQYSIVAELCNNSVLE